MVQLVAYAPVFILIGLRIIVPESTRWLIAKGPEADQDRREIEWDEGPRGAAFRKRFERAFTLES